ncbi:MAG: hypothetical protein JJV94_01940 [Sulfurospirillum sp.]|nr:hypothetical protein [Sulfurospirillum sp.]
MLSFFTYITNDYYYTIIFISIVASTLAIVVLIYYAYKQNNIMAVFLGLCMLLFSKAFIDYTTSGLENPLSYLLFSILLYIFLTKKDISKSSMSILSIYMLMVLLFLNRMDYALILLPVTTTMLFNYKTDNIRPLLIVSSIALIWFLFSLFYFGHIFPNTFYAKLEAGYPASEFIQRGLQYFEVQYIKDPITLFIIGAGIILGLLQNNYMRAFSIGLILYLLYFLKSGGDFMQGRFFAVPAFIATYIIVAYFAKRKISSCIYLGVAIIIFITANATSPLFVGKEYHNQKSQLGIADERGYYFQRYGLVSQKRKWPKIAVLGKNRPNNVKIICGGLGRAGLSSRDKTFYIDNCALTDPLLSQLPAIEHVNWRIGHQVRKIPTNYKLAVLHNTPLNDKTLNHLYQDIKISSRGELLSLHRLQSIYNINFKDYKINQNKYKDPRIHIPIIDDIQIRKSYSKFMKLEPSFIVLENNISTTPTKGIAWNANGVFIFNDEGIAIKLDKTRKIRSMYIGLDNNDKYFFIAKKGSKIVYANTIPKKRGWGITTRKIDFNKEVEIDKINIFPVKGDNRYSIGYLYYE